MEQQVCIIYAVVNGYLKEIPVARVHEFEQGLYHWLETRHHRMLRTIVETGVLSEETETQLKAALNEYIQEFTKTL